MSDPGGRLLPHQNGRCAERKNVECHRKDIDSIDEQHDPVNHLEDEIVPRDNPAHWGAGCRLPTIKESIMRKALSLIAALTALVATDAAAQVEGVDLNGVYRCVAQCLGGPGSFAHITQYGRQLNVVNDGGISSRAWVDYPGRIWVVQANEGAIYSPDGFTIQFDHGTIWQRAPVVPPQRRRLHG
jgi:hypothetical protein